ncbi:hypothetical protein D4A35_14760 [Paraclostridium bifermentans]|uniref:Camelysin metallo-endopeptidase n=1 Tax=Paraclostridium bifermentans TaxID=1490 RepID=A0A5P3XIA4_PARBF|nr:BsaA family SipW-dependent biofilm matrix protein [Paraclostridium bifermentans]QEZ70090.1 hypothetical protein D4A35_14760 [Paraclostridium bifermentans]
MNKKVQALAVSGVLTVGVIGGTLAWFTSQDKVTNTFNTASNIDNNGSGIKIIEKFDKPDNMLPGDEVNKDVQVRNTATYDQFIRVKLIPKFVDPKSSDRKEITEVNGKTLDIKKIELNFTKNLKTDENDGPWIKDGDYYYYMGKVKPSELTSMLLDSVTLSKDAGNEYQGLVFDIDVEAQSIQASNNAYETWSEAKNLFKDFGELQK